MWWRKPKPVPIPPYVPIEVKVPEPVEPAIIVDEIDTSAMTRTGVMKAWDRLSKKFID